MVGRRHTHLGILSSHIPWYSETLCARIPPVPDRLSFFFFNDQPPPEFYLLPQPDPLPICEGAARRGPGDPARDRQPGRGPAVRTRRRSADAGADERPHPRAHRDDDRSIAPGFPRRRAGGERGLGLARHVRLTLGAGYRFAGNDWRRGGGFDRGQRISGAVGSLGVQIGGEEFWARLFFSRVVSLSVFSYPAGSPRPPRAPATAGGPPDPP